MAGSVGSDDGDAGFQIAPMVDVVFVLMLFFMASAGMQVAEKELSIKLPGSPGKSIGAPPVPIIVEVAADGKVTMNNTVYGQPGEKKLQSLQEKLTQLVDASGGKDPVIIAPDPEARHERVVDVLNTAAAARVTNLTFR